MSASRMKAAILQKPGVLKVREVPRPSLNAHQVRIKVARAGICGSDAIAFRSGLARVKFPYIPGHEFSGIIIEAGNETNFHPGQSVTVMPFLSCGECAFCRSQKIWRCPNIKFYGVKLPGAFAEEVVVADHRVRLLPDYMSLDEGAFIEPLAVILHVLNRAHLQPEDNVAILGAGSLGLITIQELAARGIQFTMATGRVEQKLSLAQKFGAHLVVNATSEDVIKRGLEVIPGGFDVILDFVCSQPTINQAIALGKPGARIILIAAPHPDQLLSCDYASVYRKELTLGASYLYSDEEFNQAVSLLTKERIRVAPIITARFKLSEAPQAMDFVVNNRKEAIKVFIEP